MFTVGGAALPLVEVLVPYVSAVQDQCVHHVDCVYSALCFALNINSTVLICVKATNCLNSFIKKTLLLQPVKKKG